MDVENKTDESVEKINEPVKDVQEHTDKNEETLENDAEKAESKEEKPENEENPENNKETPENKGEPPKNNDNLGRELENVGVIELEIGEVLKEGLVEEEKSDEDSEVGAIQYSIRERVEEKEFTFDLPEKPEALLKELVLGDGTEKVETEEESEEEIGAVTAEDAKKRKESEDDRRPSFKYAFAPRVREDRLLSEKISGDFLPMLGNVLVLKHAMESYEEELEERTDSTSWMPRSSSGRTIDFAQRKLLTEKLGKLQHTFKIERLRNSILQVFVTKYLKKRSLQYNTRESRESKGSRGSRGSQSQALKPYLEKLEKVGDFFKSSKRKQDNVKFELEQLEYMKSRKFALFEEDLAEFQRKESATGVGLIYAKSGKILSEITVQNYIRQQQKSIDRMRDMRVKHIEVKNKVARIKEDSHMMDIPDSKYNLIYYEKLKSENRIYQDKIEEIDTDLVKFRKSYQDAMSTVSHLKEKTVNLAAKIQNAKDDVTVANSKIIKCRQKLNTVRRDRDTYRSMAATLKEECGLLLQPELLRDMDRSLREYEILKGELEKLKDDYDKKLRQVRDIYGSDMEVKKKKRKAKESSNVTLTKSRHSIINLDDFKPSVTQLKRVVD